MRTARRNPEHTIVAKPRPNVLRGESHDWCGSFLAGIADLALFAHPAKRIAFPHDSEADALRGDWITIGQDMGRVFERQQHAPTEEES